MKVERIIIPVAGLGTRMLPATKAIPKEMLPIVDKPIIQYIVEEVYDAGFKEIIFITHSSKNSIENHFDQSFELEATLEKRVKRSLLKEVKNISKPKVQIHTIRQGEALGLGHAILCAKTIIGKDPFAVVLPDMVIKPTDGKKNINLKLMKTKFDENQISSLLLAKASKKEISNYGIAKTKNIRGKRDYSLIKSVIEKPTLKKAPSNLFAAGRYIFNNDFVPFLLKVKPDSGGEIQLTDAIADYIKNGNKTFGYFLDGNIYDCGNKLGYLKAIVEFGKDDKHIGNDFKNFLINKS